MNRSAIPNKNSSRNTHALERDRSPVELTLAYFYIFCASSSNRSLSVDPWYTRPQHNATLRVCWKNVPSFSLWRPTPTPISNPTIAAGLIKKRQVDKACTVIAYVHSDLEGRHPVVVRCDGSLFSSRVLIAESD